MQDKPWRNEELKECEEALPRLKEGEPEKPSRVYKAKKEWVAMDSTQKFLWT